MQRDSADNQQGNKKNMRRKPRVLMARFHLDGHERGLMTVMQALRDAGMEVIYIRFINPKEIVKAALEEDADIIGVTSSQGEHLMVCSLLMEELHKNQLKIPVIVGGVVPSADVPKLMNMGIRRFFGPGSRPLDAVLFFSKIIYPGEDLEGMRQNNSSTYGAGEKEGANKR